MQADREKPRRRRGGGQRQQEEEAPWCCCSCTCRFRTAAAVAAVVLLTAITSASLLQVRFYRSGAAASPAVPRLSEAVVLTAVASQQRQQVEQRDGGRPPPPPRPHEPGASSNNATTTAVGERRSGVRAASARATTSDEEKRRGRSGYGEGDPRPSAALPPALSPRALELLRSYDPGSQLPPFWNCSSPRGGSEADPTKNASSGKLVFVHVYKTAGSSMRDLLKWYGRRCGPRSVAIVFGCSGVSASTLNETVWREAKIEKEDGENRSRRSGGRACALSHAFDALSGREYNDGTFGRGLYEHVDVVGGHLPLGVHLPGLPHQDHHQQPGGGGEVRYLTFVRDPLDKYVSGKLYSNRRRGWAAEDAIKRISYEISHLYRHGGHYEKYSKYLLTPAQREAKMSVDDKVMTMQSNLAGMSVVVGVVERMDESYQLLQRVLDGAGELDKTFRLLRSHKLVRNKSALSTSDIVRQLKANDPDFERQARVVLSSEYMVYDFAVKLHELQYDRLVVQQSRGR